MSLDAYLGEPITLQTLYLDTMGDPLPVEDPTVVVFRYDAMGVRITLAEEPLVEAGVADPGRYTYLFLVPEDLTEGATLHVEYRATRTGTGELLVTSDTLTARSRAVLGLNARFVR